MDRRVLCIMIDQNRDLRLKKLCKTIALCSAAVPMPEWPPFTVEADSYLHKYYFNHIYGLIKKARNLNIPLQSISAVINTSRASQVMHSIYGLSSSELNNDEKRDFVDFILSIIGAKRSDPFCENGTNILIDTNNIAKYINSVVISYKSEGAHWNKKAQILSKINALLFSLCDLIHVCQHASSHEFHGVYNLNNHQIILREYYDLKPIEIWPDLENLNFENISTIEIYQDVEISFSFFNHIIPTTSLPSHLVGMAVTNSNDTSTTYSLDELEEKFNVLKLVMENIARGIAKLQKKDWIQKYIEMHYYIFKPLASIVNEDWHPSKEQISIIDTPPDMRAASAFHVLNGLSYDERIIALEQLYNGFLF